MGKKSIIKQQLCTCDRTDCFANLSSAVKPGRHFCSCLQDTDFNGKPCPFFKTKEEHEDSLEAYEKRKIKQAKKAAEERKREHVRVQSGVAFKH